MIPAGPRRTLPFVAPILAIGFLGAAVLAASESADDTFETVVSPFLAAHCAECHGEVAPQGELVLTRVTSTEDVLADRDTWDYVRERVELGEMPPKERDAPDTEESAAFVAWLVERVGDPVDDGPLDPGVPVIRRLNNTEYANSVKDLVGVDFPVYAFFPTDGIGHGFDTTGSALSIPDLLLEKYLDAAARIAAEAVVVEDPENPPRRRIHPEELEGGRSRGTSRFLSTRGDVSSRHLFPRDGEYVVRAAAWATQAGPDLASMALVVGTEEAGRFDVAAEDGGSETFEARVRVVEGTARVAARFLNDYYKPDDPDPKNRDRNLAVEWIEVEGPLDPAPLTDFQRGLLERFGEDLGRGRQRAILGHVARLAWRRPVTKQEVSRLERLIPDDASLEEGLSLALEAILASPNFLFRVELDPPPSKAIPIRDLDGFELATRLSYFLWSTTPDEPLLDAAERGELETPEGYAAALDRMLASPRSRALAENFATQWLQVRNLDRIAVDPDLFPTFTDGLRASMREETVAFFDAVLREGRSAHELLDADWTLVDGALAGHYGIEGVEGDAFRRVELTGTPRRGVLGHASVLTVTSDPTRTSPVKRGKWVLEALLGAPPPAPPPGVDDLDDSPEAAAAASLRVRLEVHRRDPNCAVCHDRMDPLGFGLENYDAIGAWREADGPFPVDPSGVLPDGRAFSGPVELVGVLSADDGFVRCLARKLLVYALGRGLDRSDRRAVDEILAELDGSRPALVQIVRAIAGSDLFTRRRADTRR